MFWRLWGWELLPAGPRSCIQLTWWLFHPHDGKGSQILWLIIFILIRSILLLWSYSVRWVKSAHIAISKQSKMKLCNKGLFLSFSFLIEMFMFVLDGKIYDAYVLYTKSSEGRSVSCLETFVRRILPDVLEKQCGYNLFILGRDDLPGEGML